MIGFIFFAVLAAQLACSPLRQTELERNRVLWHASKIENYKMTVKIQKTGHATPNGTFIITVRDRLAKSIKPIDKPDVEMLDTQIQFGRYATIEVIFSFIESAEKDKQKNNRWWSRREIEYDSKLGYPKKVDLDQSGVFDDELSFEVLEFEAAESSDGEPAAKSSPPKLNSVPASEITKAEISSRNRGGPDKDFANWSGVSFSNDGTAFRSFRSMSFATGNNESSEWQKYKGVASQEQFQKFAQTLADNDFSNLQDSTEQITGTWDFTLTITYSGKTKSIITSKTGKNTAEVKAILQAFETLKNQLDWEEVK